MDRLGSALRRKVFWAVDWLRGGGVAGAVRDLKRDKAVPFDDEGLQKRTQDSLDQLLRHAVTNVPAYRRYRGEPFGRFPIVTKAEINAKREDYRSAAHRRGLRVMKTSGSTGVPFVVYQDRKKKQCVNAETVFYASEAGHVFGAPLVQSKSLADLPRRRPVRWLAKNQTFMDAVQLERPQLLAMVWQIEKMARTKRSGVSLLSYGSTLDALAAEYRADPTGFPEGIELSSITSSAEHLFPSTRETISELFGCPVHDRYSNQENGFLAQDEGKDGALFLNTTNYFFEFLAMDADRAVAPGEEGRIVVTDLRNYAMPLIRYDTGDVGTHAIVEDSCGVPRIALTSLGGRQLDFITDVTGAKLSPYVFANLLRELLVGRYRITQKGTGEYVLEVVAVEDFENSAALKEELRKKLGAEANVLVEKVGAIPPLASGKHSFVVRETEARGTPTT